MKRIVVKKGCKIFLISVCVFLELTTFSQNYKILNWTEIPIDTSHWDFEYPIGAEINSGEKIVSIKGKAFSKQIEGTNYSIEMQVKDTEWPCLVFHVLDFNNYEMIYFRNFNDATNEAIQYVPVYKGLTPWRLYGKE